ncbi:hypothetical protein AURDEDRAFT_181762 [Auricularia subglabra TFB-10046 SS5]|nr:hypothetical protein AURDEDRAFT_181762 [Auricularia subglabra TFB-10046 SS5]
MWIPSSGRIIAPHHWVARMAPAANATLDVQQKVWNKEMTHAVVWTWLGLNIAGQVLLSLLLATLLFSRRLKAQRHPILLNFVVAWLLSTIPACLLLYGGAQEGAPPDPGLCLYNAAMMAGIPPMVAVAFLAVVAQVFVMLRSVATHTTYVRRTWLTVLLLAGPYVAYVAFCLLVGVIGFYNPADVDRDTEIVFCTVRNHSLGTYIWSFTVLMVAVTLVLGGKCYFWIVVMLYRNWRDVRGGKVESEFDAHLIIRALAFTIFELFILATSLLTIFKQDSTPPKFMQALAPLAVFLIFATQPDVIYSWFFCFGRPARGDDGGDAKEPFADKPAMGRSTSTLQSTVSVQSQPHPQRVSTYDMTRASFTPRPVAPELAIPPRPLYLAGAAPSSRPMSPANTSRPPSQLSEGMSSIGSARSARAQMQTNRPPSNMSMDSSIGSARSARTHMSSTSVGSGLGSARRPHAGPPRAHGGRYHHQHHSSVTSYASTSSGGASVTSHAPLLRTVDEFRADSRQGQSGSYHSHAGVLGGERL